MCSCGASSSLCEREWSCVALTKDPHLVCWILARLDVLAFIALYHSGGERLIGLKGVAQPACRPVYRKKAQH